MLAPIEINPAEIFHHHHTLPPLPEVVNKIHAMQKDESSEIRALDATSAICWPWSSVASHGAESIRPSGNVFLNSSAERGQL